MTIPLFEPRASHPQDRAAWLASVAVHAGLLAGLAYLSWSTFGRGNSIDPASNDNIVVGLVDRGDDAADGSDMQGLSDLSVGVDPEGLTAPLSQVLGADEVMRPVTSADDATGSVAIAPQISRSALGGGGTSATRTISEPAAAKRSGSLRLGQLADRATVTVFGAVGEGSKFVYLFDHSTSMAGAPLAAAKQQLVGSLDALDRVHQFQIIFFNHEVQAWDLTGGQRRVPFASDANKRLAGQFVQSVIATGATERLTPLRRALAMNPDVVFFLTDADDAMPDYDVAEVVDRAQSSGTKVACIEFGDGPAASSDNFLTQISHATGGDYVYVDTTRLFSR